jgi:formate C-acetyltransferase
MLQGGGQVNVVDRYILLKAQEEPDKYQDLVVRIAGYSDYL